MPSSDFIYDLQRHPRRKALQKTLSVCYCGLMDLDGINNAPNLVNLVAAFNAISDLYPVTEMRKINTLDLEW